MSAFFFKGGISRVSCGCTSLQCLQARVFFLTNDGRNFQESCGSAYSVDELQLTSLGTQANLFFWRGNVASFPKTGSFSPSCNLKNT
uniref:Uncharacterized protein n=1 Tax=Trichuris muris TaxID=70415 RepID=A0A5S6QAU2_TRIMR